MFQSSSFVLSSMGRIGPLLFVFALLTSGPVLSAPAQPAATPAKAKPRVTVPRPAPASKPAPPAHHPSKPVATKDKSATPKDASRVLEKEKIAEAETAKLKQAEKPGEKTGKKVEKGPGNETSKIDISNYPPPTRWPWGTPFKVITPDGMILRGMYMPPRPPQQTVVVFVDGGMYDFVTSFRPLVARLAAKGYGIAVYDARGSGISMEKVGGGKYDLRPHSNEPKPYKKMIDDVKLVVKFLREKKKIRPFRLVLCGAGIGANVAIMAAAELPMDIRSVAAVSPGSNYRGLRPLSAAQNLGGRSLFAICAADDSFAYTLIQQLKRTVPNSDTSIVSGKANGHALLNSEVVEKIADWLDAH